MANVAIIRNIRNAAVAANEVITRFSVNRNFQKLLENDKLLSDFYKRVFDELDIGEYVDPKVSGIPYEYDDIVWFQDSNKDLWLLRCVTDDNQNSPQLAVSEANGAVPNFRKYGWEDQNEYIDIFDSNLIQQLDMYAKQQLDAHLRERKSHRFGRLSTDENDPDYIDKKVLLKDLSNIDEKRKTVFFPYQTGYFTTDAITHGIYRIWDCGVIEFDLTFRVGWRGQTAYGQDILSCNDMQFNKSNAMSPRFSDYNENSNYFQTLDDMKIFMNPHGIDVYKSETVRAVHGNRNKYANTYFARLELFPKPISFKDHLISKFVDVNYMVFGGPRMADDGDFAAGTVR